MAAVLRGFVSLVYENVKATKRFLPVRNSGYMYARLAPGDNMSNRWSKFRLLMWKNWVLAKRHRKQTLMEILAPVMFTILLVVIRGLVHPVDYKEPTLFAPFSPADIKKTLIPYIINATDFGGFVVYSPRSPVLEKIMNNTATRLGLQAIPMPSERFFLSLLKTNYVFMKLNLAAVFFDESLAGAKKLPKNITVRIRFPGESRVPISSSTISGVLNWKTNLIFPLFQEPGPRFRGNNEGGDVPGYFPEGFLALQHAVSSSLTEYFNNGQKVIPTVQLQRFPYPAYYDDPLLPALVLFVAIVIMLSFSYTSIYVVKSITLEKEHQLKEAMKIMGLPNWLHWVAWFLENFILLLFSVTLMVILMKVRWFRGSNLAVFTLTDSSVLFVFLVLYITVSICFCFMVSVFFTRANIAATVAGLGWFILYAPYLFMQFNYSGISTTSKMMACLFSNTAMSYGFQLLLMHEGIGQGLTWSTVWQPALPGDDFLFGHILVMMAIDSLIYFLITIYVEAIFPGSYGVPKPWYFPLQLSFWCGDDRKRKKMEEDPVKDWKGESTDMNESEPKYLHPGIQIKRMRKVYANKVAVNNLTLNLYEGQITVLLGHNGAGKTTTMSMLTGMITPTSGTALIGGYDVRTDIEGVRASLGLCPQHNVLFEELTVREHLYFFSKLKGMEDQDIEEEIHKYLRALQLEKKEHAQASTLSGGMQRKLSAAVALCGNSKVVMFDEPTSGMDPAARRTLWNLLEAEKHDRTILLSTHFMDEADVLGDRIAIMSGGDLQCCGSSFFLKKKYGAGYYLIIVKGPNCNVSMVTELLRKYIPDLKVGQNIASELSYLLEEERLPVFEPMLRELEDRKEFLNILSYGVSLTTMEEVFMKVGREQDMPLIKDDYSPVDGKGDHPVSVYSEGQVDDSPRSTTSVFPKNIDDIERPTAMALTINQLRAMLMKNVYHTWRTKILFFIEILIPISVMIVTFLVVRQWQGSKDLPSLDMDIKIYGSKSTPVGLLVNNTAALELYQIYKSLFTSGLVDMNQREDSFGHINMTELILSLGAKELSLIRQDYIVGSTFDVGDDGTPLLTGWFNNLPLHSPAIALGLLHNTILKWVMGDPDYSLNIINQPLPYNQDTKASFQLTANNLGFQLSFNLGFAMSFVTAFYVMFQIKERVSKSKHLQLVSGVKILIYWGTSYLWDLVTFFIVTLWILVTMISSQEEGYSTFIELVRYFVVFMSFACGVLPLIYLFSYLYSSPSTGFTRVVMLNAFTGVAGFLIVCILDMPSLDLSGVSHTVDWLLMSVPLYSLGISLRNMYMNNALQDACRLLATRCHTIPNPCCRDPELCPNGKCIPMTDNFFDWTFPGVGRNIFFFYINGIVFASILMFIEFRCFEKILYRTKLIGARLSNVPEEVEDEDSDVAAERKLIRMNERRTLRMNYKLLLIDVSKFYGDFQAVDQLCVGVKRGECFGLLGVNGAGKTSTFKMLTGDEKISGGEAYVNGLSLKTSMQEVHQFSGYCPQFDALIDELTGRETLTMFCLLRGIPSSKVPYIVNQLADKLIFTKHIDKSVKDYSGGNKRKLSTAVALVGDPPVVYLDEPTTGMDVVAKRHLWNVICQVRDSGKCIVLTSHSMEECEALCTRIAIMVNGRFKCLGSPQHLKSKFAEGYTLTIKVKPREDADGRSSHELEMAKEFVRNSFPGSLLREEHEGLMTYHVPRSTLTWSRMFGILEDAKRRLNIEDYSLGQTSLEQVFLTFTKTQRPADS